MIRSRLKPIEQTDGIITQRTWGIVGAVISGADRSYTERMNSKSKTIKVYGQRFWDKERFKGATCFYLRGFDSCPEGVG